MYNYSLLLKKIDNKIYRITTCNKSLPDVYGLVKGYLRFYIQGLDNEFFFGEEELSHFKEALITNNYIIRGNKVNISSISLNFLQHIIEDILKTEAIKIQRIFRKYHIRVYRVGR